MRKTKLEGDRLVLSGLLGLDSLMDYKREIDEGVSADKKLVVDLAGITVEGSAVLALLVYMLRRSRAAGGSLTFVSPDRELIEMADLAGLVDLLGLEV